MAQVFISYFKPERNLTQALADDITTAGFSVRWDTHLLPDDRFRAVIDPEIEACTRAIIIWTPQSIQRDWVVSEAEHAHRLGKLVNTFAGGLDLPTATQEMPHVFFSRPVLFKAPAATISPATQPT